MIVTKMLSGASCDQEASLALSTSRVGEAADLSGGNVCRKKRCPEMIDKTSSAIYEPQMNLNALILYP